jgi:hypothetical protein
VMLAFSVPQTCVLSEVSDGADGVPPVVMVTELDATLVPHEVVQVAVYVPAPTDVVVPVALLLQVTVPAQLAAVRVAVSAPHNWVLLAEIVGAVGKAPVVIVTAFDATLVPQEVVQVAV